MGCNHPQKPALKKKGKGIPGTDITGNMWHFYLQVVFKCVSPQLPPRLTASTNCLSVAQMLDVWQIQHIKVCKIYSVLCFSVLVSVRREG